MEFLMSYLQQHVFRKKTNNINVKVLSIMNNKK